MCFSSLNGIPSSKSALGQVYSQNLTEIWTAKRVESLCQRNGRNAFVFEENDLYMMIKRHSLHDEAYIFVYFGLQQFVYALFEYVEFYF